MPGTGCPKLKISTFLTTSTSQPLAIVLCMMTTRSQTLKKVKNARAIVILFIYLLVLLLFILLFIYLLFFYYFFFFTAPAVDLANRLALNGSKNPVMVLKGLSITPNKGILTEVYFSTGGYERFSAEYPFLRTEKTIYTPMVNTCLPSLFFFLSPSCMHVFVVLGTAQASSVS